MRLVDQSTTNTLPKLLRRNAKQWANDPGIREKNRGIWETSSWQDYDAQVRDFALGLAAMGFKRGGKLSVVGDNRPRLYCAMLGAMALGGMAVPVYQDSIASELVYVLEHAEVSVIVAEDQEQVDKILSLRDQLPHLSLVVYDDPRGLSTNPDPLLKSFADIQAMGRDFAKGHPDFYAREVEAGRAEEIALIAYTSGTTGRPKGVLLSHWGMVATAESFLKGEEVRKGDNWLAYLPMAWVGDTMWTLGAALAAGVIINCPESPETVIRDLRELGPDGIIAPPAIWENLMRGLQIRSADATPMKRRTFEHFKNYAVARELARTDGKNSRSGLRHKLGEFLVYGPVRDQLGFRRARWCCCMSDVSMCRSSSSPAPSTR